MLKSYRVQAVPLTLGNSQLILFRPTQVEDFPPDVVREVWEYDGVDMYVYLKADNVEDAICVATQTFSMQTLSL